MAVYYILVLRYDKCFFRCQTKGTAVSLCLREGLTGFVQPTCTFHMCATMWQVRCKMSIKLEFILAILKVNISVGAQKTTTILITETSYYMRKVKMYDQNKNSLIYCTDRITLPGIFTSNRFAFQTSRSIQSKVKICSYCVWNRITMTTNIIISQEVKDTLSACCAVGRTGLWLIIQGH